MTKRRKRHRDPDSGPNTVRRFIQRNRFPIGIVACGVLLFGTVWGVQKYWRGGCAGTTAERTVVNNLRADPLLTALPPKATTTSASTTYRSCRNGNAAATRNRPLTTTLPIAVEMVNEYRLAEPMTVAELYDHHGASVGRAEWRLTHVDARSLSYCRMLGDYRVASLMTLDDRRLTTETNVWTDGAKCGAEVSVAR